MTQNKQSATGAIMATVAGITAAAVGAYYLYGHKDAEKNRAKVKGWMLKAKGEVLEELEKAQEVTESAYMSAVDTVAKKYDELKQIDANELTTFMAEMKAHWNGIKKTLQSSPLKKRANGDSKAKKSSGKSGSTKSATNGKGGKK